MNEYEIFLKIIKLIKEVDFEIDVNVSVFETSIRVLGGLLSSHLIVVGNPNISKGYDGILLLKAVILADLLLPAFDTPTGLPYGTINLLHGVPKGETPVTCTACAGTFHIEWAWLSLLTGDSKYEHASRKSMRALWNSRSNIGLFGSHINIETGEWVYRECSIGGGVDSYYEYLLKTYVAFSDEVEFGEMFLESYKAIKKYLRRGGLHYDVDVNTGSVLLTNMHSLGAFWPGGSEFEIKVIKKEINQALFMDCVDGLLRLA
ncbi:ER degradation-enhancing alpha-mannosidase-like protein 2 [Clydaea vesicula]|uniref:alpha-1,2-Mannosidase n=1 Tax=Clydaea vesicula TaxID=447962 RepID=A0AAD5TTU4_9FUNG|nr:ER degradation-enhancing alpha-mannosidase-like protein 2 [Clydaea vesicula]